MQFAVAIRAEDVKAVESRVTQRRRHLPAEQRGADGGLKTISALLPNPVWEMKSFVPL